ncbi:glutaredoxin family protein [Blastopirellula marina]|uniref:Glutaredoxin family protein n=1 Tax=Blastopirellula marina TaxID=124 RepID=A0A2S8F823_9BACT|nr:glutaredoxin family protein [Blastopirellula marina]PQO28270.1 glutaredoxin family protein [Blastopirellula marina]PTL41810.1 glutaredoxin family protein [Blastopirellula marina]
MNTNTTTKYGLPVVIYTRQGCSCCDKAAQVIQDFVSEITFVDIDHDPELRQKFDTMVPVVEINGKIRFRGKVEPLLLKRILAAEVERQTPAPTT